jgi:hypothetical protein
MIRGQEARGRIHQLSWFVCTGAVLLLFGYWALQVVFRPPRVKVTHRLDSLALPTGHRQQMLTHSRALCRHQLVVVGSNSWSDQVMRICAPSYDGSCAPPQPARASRSSFLSKSPTNRRGAETPKAAPYRGVQRREEGLRSGQSQSTHRTSSICIIFLSLSYLCAAYASNPFERGMRETFGADVIFIDEKLY